MSIPIQAALDAFQAIAPRYNAHVSNTVNGAQDPAHFWEQGYIWVATNDGSMPDPVMMDHLLAEVENAAPGLLVQISPMPPAAQAQYPDTQIFWASVGYSSHAPAPLPMPTLPVMPPSPGPAPVPGTVPLLPVEPSGLPIGLLVVGAILLLVVTAK